MRSPWGWASWASFWRVVRYAWTPLSKRRQKNGHLECLHPTAGIYGVPGGPLLPRPDGCPSTWPRASRNLVGGFHTEYSGIKLMMFLVAEYLHMIAASFLIVLLFFGGWHFWGLTGGEPVAGIGLALLRIVVLLVKFMLVVLFFMVARWSWPRFRFDQLMNLAWKVMLPLGLVNLVGMALWIEYRPAPVYGRRRVDRDGDLRMGIARCVMARGGLACPLGSRQSTAVGPGCCPTWIRRRLPRHEARR